MVTIQKSGKTYWPIREERKLADKYDRRKHIRWPIRNKKILTDKSDENTPRQIREEAIQEKMPMTANQYEENVR